MRVVLLREEQDTAVSRRRELEQGPRRAEEVSEESQERSCLLGGEGCGPWSPTSE